MAEIIDCGDEFKIRQQVNYVRRKLAEWGHDNVSVTIMPDPESDTGIGIVIVDNATGASRQLDMDIFDQQ